MRGAEFMKKFVREDFPKLSAASGAKLVVGGETYRKWGSRIPLHDDETVSYVRRW